MRCTVGIVTFSHLPSRPSLARRGEGEQYEIHALTALCAASKHGTYLGNFPYAPFLGSLPPSFIATLPFLNFPTPLLPFYSHLPIKALQPRPLRPEKMIPNPPLPPSVVHMHPKSAPLLFVRIYRKVFYARGEMMCYDRCGSSSPLSGEKTLFESEGRMSPSGSGNFLSAICYTCYTVNNGARVSLDSLQCPSEKT